MKKKLLQITIALFAGGVFTVNAQSFVKGQKDLNIGIGLGGGYGSTVSGTLYAGETQSSTPPISASLDFGITDAISLGGYVGYTGTKWTYTGTDFYNGAYVNYTNTESWTYYIIGVRGAYHFSKFISNEKVDLYAGIMLGDAIATNTFTTTDPNPSYVHTTSTGGGGVFSGFAGCRYRFSDHVGAFGEIGYGISYLNLGLNLKF